MTQVIFFSDSGKLTGFKITGHSTDDCSDTDGKIVCAAVSSAAYMAANTITDILRDKAEINVSDAEMQIRVKSASLCETVLLGFKLHIDELAKQYDSRIKVIIWRNNNA